MNHTNLKEQHNYKIFMHYASRILSCSKQTLPSFIRETRNSIAALNFGEKNNKVNTTNPQFSQCRKKL